MIDKNTFNYLRPQNPRTARFYILPKIHKEGAPGRPIVSSCGSTTEKISQFIDYYLHPLVTRIPSYIKDTTDFLLKLKSVGRVLPGSLLLTLHVRPLYTNIPHEEGIEACRSLLETRNVQELPMSDIIELITLILKRNNFSFDDNHYLQIKGTAMGTRMAPSYANIFMDSLERKILAEEERIPSTWWRYIDDIFAIWPHGEQHLTTFINQINQFHPSIKFTAEWSSKSVSFLDTEVSIDDEEFLTTDLHVKKTDTYQYLHRDSCHPYHCKHGIPYSQALRIRRICSEEENYLRRVRELKGFLTNRGYDEDEVQTQIDKAARFDREALLQSKQSKTPLDRIPLVVTYHPGLPPLKGCLLYTSPSPRDGLLSRMPSSA